MFDIAVNLCSDSETFRKWYGIKLTKDDKKCFLIPGSFAYGFLELRDIAGFHYKYDDIYI